MGQRYTDVQRARDYKDVFSGPVGRRVLHDIMGRAGVFAPIQAFGEQGQRAEGMRQFALSIGSYVVFDGASFMDAWTTIKKENEE
jgi:hypothetical protein